MKIEKIVLFGFAGCGTTTIGKGLAQRCNFKFFSTGNIIRELAKERGETIYEFQKTMENDNSIDISIDKKSVEFSKKNKDFIFDSLLAWHFVEDSFKIKLKCEDDVRFERISKRENISFEEAKQKTKKREEEHTFRYSKVYSNIKFPPNDDVFDLVIDTTNLTEKEILDKISEKINLQKS